MAFIGHHKRQGIPRFKLSRDHVATIVDLLCRGSRRTRANVILGISEPNITKCLRKNIRIEKHDLNLTNLEIHREVTVDSSSGEEGRIDIVIRFREQFGEEDDYVAVECKKVRARDANLNIRFITEGMDRFAEGKYSEGHERGFMLGYVLRLPVEDILEYLNLRIKDRWGEEASLHEEAKSKFSLAVRENTIPQGLHHRIKLTHVFVDMT